ncbi:2,3-diaminopropionate biosynthesis protein SbnA [Streptomyces clavuligerus]|uniref:N-(2-amino-2-carboxyethyl)-L-glutamate synthase n=1 Tax=Streptomyces clavuligerus TaxID=1901 RepID=B5GRZ9_STRCL|nr:2,3-diaminopropionate biosynthesis protein SbnA [Streptomyces clavuligerus]EDY49095.1 cysteine synthase [Streptomyces clavuligerus]EFG03791.1 Cysteine synthase [Streptomyces clavuligerus]MBY6307679.1 2,3-diaminopropionate biosynthesis protein SbnA [Streptomyces clavuligerus]QCS09774.1 2,3-diaminopropionate biosynthesis protein SbnA [Streptomyces clavuligerus]QPJ98184.1 2,3-diaminopropionate biosynthesis protein SbnA [Streptomyces clavuligerus]
MTIISAPHELVNSDTYVDLRAVLDRRLYLKCEGMNFGGSVKMRAAVAMVAEAERRSLLGAGTALIESSSGNLGVALSVVAAGKGIPFTCVTDARCNPGTVAAMRALGTEVVVVEEPHAVDGFLGARLDLVRRRCAADPHLVWLNQYTNEANVRAHYEGTAPRILSAIPDLDVLFVGVGTGGTAVGCARYVRDRRGGTRVVAVDAVGSVTFGGPGGRRLIPGLGASVVPPLFDTSLFDDTVEVAEVETVRGCRLLSSHGMLFGGSTGTVVSGALDWLERNDPDRELTSVCISADMGDRYLDTVYDDAWVLKHYGPRSLEPMPGARPRARTGRTADLIGAV